jgi:hypothetical protein
LVLPRENRTQLCGTFGRPAAAGQLRPADTVRHHQDLSIFCIEQDPRLSSQKQASRGRRRRDPLASVWDSEVVPLLKNTPGLRPVAIFDEIRRRHPESGVGIRRTLVCVCAQVSGAVSQLRTMRSNCPGNSPAAIALERRSTSPPGAVWRKNSES